jgi:hypothetical protein
MVTAELAAALPVLVIFVAVALAAVSVSAQRVRAQDAAREAARAAARGDDVNARRYGELTAPSASIIIARSGDRINAQARVVVHPLARWLPSVTIVEHAVAAAEPSADIDARPP